MIEFISIDNGFTVSRFYRPSLSYNSFYVMYINIIFLNSTRIFIYVCQKHFQKPFNAHSGDFRCSKKNDSLPLVCTYTSLFLL